ncbi:ABC transporter permease [Propylenella binzhouense]|uniref:ABC transporter permease n=1 Tax=Propylenella binzhouense TaxID=2555902 RepID=A0A964WRW3_9HYPH|nr:ABC transporter permease [Propylenella binzhouense]MYZ46338.1 ABC transporter permease [Propylenella binzhouense]
MRGIRSNHLAVFIVKRLLATIPLMTLVIAVSFVLIQIAPGDPITVLIGEGNPSDAQIAEIRARLGLDQPIYVQLWHYFASILHLDLGYSYVSSGPVIELIAARLPNTLILMLPSLLIFTVVGVAIGVYAATRPYSARDNAISVLAVLGYSVPVFVLGQMALLFFASWLGWFPTQGMRNFRAPATGLGGLADLLMHLALPAVVLGTRYLAVNARFARTAMIEALGQDYITSARAQGLGEGEVQRQALRNALLPLITVLGMNFADILTGTVLVEIVFGWPGLGRLMYDAIFGRDYPLLMGLFVIVALGVVLINAATDIIYGLVDPRIRNA